MRHRGNGIKGWASQRWIIHLLLVAFTLRALIPVGYMPDLAAASRGVLRIVICTAAGAKLLTVDENGDPAPQERADHSDKPCAFSGLASVAVPALEAATVGPPELGGPPLIARPSVEAPPARAGPAHRTRAPPLSS